jgi:tRNA (guanine37-N1)-methyltransferase
MRIDVLTIFPSMFAPVLGESIMKRAQASGSVIVHIHDIRDYTTDKHRKVDDRPYGGGSGMVMTPQPIFDAVKDILKKSALRSHKAGRKVYLLSPRGRKLGQKDFEKIARLKHLVLICGHYEGVDERVAQFCVDEEISVGDYVLTGGELPAMVVIDAAVRLIPGVLGNAGSASFETFHEGLLEYPQYTRPAVFEGKNVPEVLLTGDHARIAAWRKKEARKLTKKRRPDLLKKT